MNNKPTPTTKFPMRLIQILTQAESKLGYQVVEGNIEGSHYIQFIKDHKICGFIKSNGGGTWWNLPDDVHAMSQGEPVDLQVAAHETHEHLEQS